MSGATSSPQPVKSFASGTLNEGEYGALIGFSASHMQTTDSSLRSSVTNERRRRVIIVGGGLNGIQQATVLLRDGSIRLGDMQIFDALDNYGGVWEKNKYPGCACDVPAMVYTTSYNVNKDYTHFYAKRAEIQDYYARFARDYQLDRVTQFRSLVQACTWDEERMTWEVVVANQATGQLETWIADVVCQCIGSLDRPKWGTTPGREKFQGASWHTAYWQDYDLTDKRVAIVGCGPSAAQIIPEIVDKTKHLTIYMRTPPVCIPRRDFAYSRLFRWALSYVPFFAWAVRAHMNFRMIRLGQKMATEGHPLNDEMTRMAISFMESQIKDPELREIVRPHSKFYCKRPLRLDTFYPALARSNCTVLREDLVRYTETGVISTQKTTGKEVERQFDVIIFGTGFNAAQYLEHEKILGLNGLDLQAKWKAHPEALYGLATSGFPNMFFCFGPNSGQVWSSQQDTWERQANLVAKAVRTLTQKEQHGKKFAMHPKRSVEQKYNTEVQRRQSGVYVWAAPSCVTYYKNDDGWNTFTMPWSWWQFRRMLRKIFWEEWDVIEKPLEKVVLT